MKWFLDENFPRGAAAFLRGLGHEVFDIRGTTDEGATDELLFRMAQEAGAIFLTTDRDFYHTVPQLFERHHGVVVIALRQPGRKDILNRLQWFLEHFEEAAVSNHVFLLRDEAWRVLPPRGRADS